MDRLRLAGDNAIMMALQFGADFRRFTRALNSTTVTRKRALQLASFSKQIRMFSPRREIVILLTN